MELIFYFVCGFAMLAAIGVCILLTRCSEVETIINQDNEN